MMPLSDAAVREEIIRRKGAGTWHELSEALGYSPAFLNLVYLEQRKIPVSLGEKLGFRKVWVKEGAEA